MIILVPTIVMLLYWCANNGVATSEILEVEGGSIQSIFEKLKDLWYEDF